MAEFLWLLWTLRCALAAGGPLQLLTWPDGGNPLVRADVDESARPPSFRLPVFEHAPGPHPARELLRPAPRVHGPVPAAITSLLFPQTPQRREGGPQWTGARSVEVQCGVDSITVRVDRFRMGAWKVPSLFRLGSCQATQVSPRFLYFHYGLTECDGESQVVGGQLVYTFRLCYVPPPQGEVVRVVAFTLPIHCHYNRFHHSYKVGFRPQVQHSTFMKSLTSKRGFSLTVCNAQWEPVSPAQSFILGESVYFVAQTGPLLAGERLYVDSCYVTSSSDPNNRPKVDIITNYGCMKDSRRAGSSSLFLSGGSSVLKFSVDALLFGEVSQLLFLHCSMSVDILTSSTSKSCNYNQATGRWEELLVAAPPVCSCCDSICADNQDTMKNLVSSPGWLTQQKPEGLPKMKVTHFQAEEQREWETHGGPREDTMEELLKRPRSFSPQTKLGPAGEKEEAVLKRTPPPGTDLSQRGGGDEEGEMGAVVLEKADGQLMGLTADGISASDQAGPEENEIFLGGEEASDAKNGSVSSLSSDSGTGMLADGPGTPTIPATNSSSASDGSSAENVTSTVTCSDNECGSGTATLMDEPDAGDDVVDSSPSSESPDAGPGTDGPGSAWDSGVRESPSTDESEDLNGGQTGPLWSEQADSAEVLAAEEPDGTPASEVDSGDGKALDGEKALRSLQVRESESEPGRPACADGSLGDCDSGDDDGEANHPAPFTGEVYASSRSARSEQIQGSGHSTVVAVVTSLQGSQSGPMSDREWVEVLQEWLGF